MHREGQIPLTLIDQHDRTSGTQIRSDSIALVDANGVSAVIGKLKVRLEPRWYSRQDLNLQPLAHEARALR